MKRTPVAPAASTATATSTAATAASSVYSSASAGFRTRRGRVSIDYEKVKEDTQKQTQDLNRPQLMSGTAFAQSPLATLVMLEFHFLQVHIDKNPPVVLAKQTSAEIDRFLQEARDNKLRGVVPLKLNKMNPDLSSDSEAEGEPEWYSDNEK